MLKHTFAANAWGVYTRVSLIYPVRVSVGEDGN